MPDWTILIPAFTSLLSAGAAVLAWLAKLRWSEEFAAAKDETIKAKEAQIAGLRDQFTETIRAKDALIEGLKDLSSMKVREYFVSMKQSLEEYNDKLKADLAEAQGENEQLTLELKSMHDEQSLGKVIIEGLQIRQKALNRKVETLQRQIEVLRVRSKELDEAREIMSRVATAQLTTLSFLDDSAKVTIMDDDSSDDGETQPVSRTNLEQQAS